MRKIISLGKRSSAIATLIAVAYGILQILFEFPVIPHAHNLSLYFLPLFLLAPAFLVVTVCLDILAPAKLRRWTIAAWGLATINCMMMIMVYCSQPGHLNPSHFNWETGGFNLLVFSHHTSLIAVKYASYLLMSASIFILAFPLRKCSSKWHFRSLLINGLLLPLVIISYFYPHYYYLSSVWLIIFPFTTFQTTSFFRIKERRLQKKEKSVTSPFEWVIQ